MLHGFRTVLVAAAVLTLGAATAFAQAPEQRALDYLAANASRHALSSADADAAEVVTSVPGLRGRATHVYLAQRHAGLPVVPGQMTVSVLEDGRVLSAMGELVNGLALRAPSASPSITPEAAAQAMAAFNGLVPTEPLTVAARKNGAEFRLTSGGLSQYALPVRLVYALDGEQLVLAWEVSIYTNDHQHDWFGYVDAVSGRVFDVSDRVIHDDFGPSEPAPAAAPAEATTWHAPMLPVVGGASYRVYEFPVESPYYSSPVEPADGRTMASGVEDLTASPFGWHDTDGVAGAEYTTSRGNNVFAYPDTDNNNSPDSNGIPDGGAALQFDFPLDLTAQPGAYKEAAVTNLFYWNNLIHDVLFQYGFDEESGNFQVTNYGGGGNDFDDAVFAEAQDGGGTNNANFWTPTDLGAGALGPRPRMQMYRGANTNPNTDGDLDNLVIVHEYGHGISIRLTGGPLNVDCLRNGEQMGEGWSDWYGTLFTIEPGDAGPDRRAVGTYLFGQGATGGGIRLAPYSTDFAINNYTYGRTTSMGAVHQIGFVWATILWEMTWDLIDEYGFDPDIHNADGTAGNQIAMALVTEGMKFQPCSPGFVDGRDGILAADEALYGGAHTDLLWAAFARRGLGALADQGSSDTTSDNVESFVEPEANPPAAVTDLAVIPDGDAVTLTFIATGDDGTTGTAAAYDIRSAASPILNDADFDAATPLDAGVTPQEAGTPEAVRVDGLDFETTYHFALKVRDESFNVSPLSNPASGTTLAAPVANIPTASVDAYLAEGTTTATVRFRNDGPSSLSYDLSLAETDGTAARRLAAASAKTGTAPALSVAPSTPAIKGVDGPSGVAQRLGGGGPDAFGYRWLDSNDPSGPTYDWIDISSTGTALSLDDDARQSVALPFTFSFYGQDFTSVDVVSNGFLSFDGGSATQFTNPGIPSTEAPNAVLAPYWDDLDPPEGGSILYQDMGDGRFVVSWIGIQHYVQGGGQGSFTFQVILNAGGQILYQYEEIAPAGADVNSATIGIENLDGTDGLQIVNNAPYIEDGLAVRIAALFVDAAPSAGLVPAGGGTDVVLTFDAAGLADGVYTAEMTVLTNDPATPSVVVPVTMTVGSGAVAAVSSRDIEADVPVNEPGAVTMTLSNPGSEMLTWSLADASGTLPAWMGLDLTSGSLGVGESVDVTMSMDATGYTAGTSEMTALTLTSNAAAEPSITIDVTMHVVTAVDGEDGAIEGTHELGLPTPNPSRGIARTELRVSDAQSVRAELYDTLGRRVATLFDGPVAAGSRVDLELREASLAAGTYVLRVTGERFADARRLTVTR